MSWRCSQCTFENHPALHYCEICGHSKVTEIVDLTESDDETHEKAAVATTVGYNMDGMYDTGHSLATTGIIDLLHVALSQEGRICNKSVKSGYHLCTPPCVHITQRGSVGENWSCGYRNIQMVCSSLMQLPEYRAVLFNGDGVIPDILHLQHWIETAWMNGFDITGASQFDFSLQGKTSWIGATECAALFRFFGIRAMIVDFPGDTDDDLAERVTRWVGIYFGKCFDSVCPFSPPLYFQHEGHSRTIVGCEYESGAASSSSMSTSISKWLNRDVSSQCCTSNSRERPPASPSHGTHSCVFSASVEELYVFDPLSVGGSIKRNLEKGNKTWRRQIKRTKQLIDRKGAYQILYIAPGIMDKHGEHRLEYERSKVLRISDKEVLLFNY